MESTKIPQDTGTIESSQTIDLMAKLSQEADQIIVNAGKVARQEAEQEIERFLKQYEEKTRQIVLKIREEANIRATEIADNVRVAILTKIEETSADAIAGAITDSSSKVEELAKNHADILAKEAESSSVKANSDQKDSPAQTQADNLSKSDEGDKAKDVKGDVKLENKAVSEIKFERDFDQWLNQ